MARRREPTNVAPLHSRPAIVPGQDTVARYTENIPIDKSFVDTWRAVHLALMAYNWNIVTVRDNTFFLKERMSLTTMLWRNPCRFAVHVRREDDTHCTLFLIGSTLGFGPLPKGRIRQVSSVLKSQLLAAIAQIEPEKPEEAETPKEKGPGAGEAPGPDRP